jgi:hypothetical protein
MPKFTKKADTMRLSSALMETGVVTNTIRETFNSQFQKLASADPRLPRVSLNDVFDFSLDPVLATLARQAFSLNSAKDISILIAFGIAKLDPKNPLHWRAIMEVLCKHHFEPPRRGGPTKWTLKRYQELKHDCLVAQKKTPSLRFFGDIAKHLRRHQREKYGNYSSETLRALVGEAFKGDGRVKLVQDALGTRGQHFDSAYWNEFFQNLDSDLEHTVLRGKP